MKARKKFWTIMGSIVVLALLLLCGCFIFIERNTNDKAAKRTVSFSAKPKGKEEKKDPEKNQTEEKPAEKKEIKKPVQEKAETKAEEEMSDQELAATLVTVKYREGENDTNVKLLQESENGIKILVYHLYTGNGLAEIREPSLEKINATVQDIQDAGGYLVFLCEIPSAKVPMIFYKDGGKVAFQDADILPGQTNNYEEVEEKQLEENGKEK